MYSIDLASNRKVALFTINVGEARGPIPHQLLWMVQIQVTCTIHPNFKIIEGWSCY